MPFKELVDRARAMLSSRRPMTATKKLRRAANRASQPGAAGEKRNVKLHKASPIGKLQARNKRTKDILDQLD